MEFRARPTQLDHLVYAVSDLDQGVAHVEELFGVRPAIGGVHAGWGTRNALLSLGNGVYFEVIGPDPSQTVDRRPLGVDFHDLPRLTTWAVRTESIAEVARQMPILGDVSSMERVRPDGSRLVWQLTDPFAERLDGVIPFLIQWMDGAHPSETAPLAGRLKELWIEHPEPDLVSRYLAGLGIEAQIREGRPGLHARIETPRGVITL